MHRYTATDPGTQVHTETDSQTQTIRPQSLRNLDADPGAEGNRDTHTETDPRPRQIDVHQASITTPLPRPWGLLPAPSHTRGEKQPSLQAPWPQSTG